MVSASTTTRAANVLLGRTGGDPAFQDLLEGLRRSGHQVTERTSSPVGAHNSPQATAEVLNDVDVGVLVVRQADEHGNGPQRPFQGITRDAGVMQGRIGMDRVLLLVEDSVNGLSSDPGISVVRYPAGRPDAALPELVERIRTIVPAPDRGIHEKLAVVERSRADNLMMPFLLLGVVVLVAALGAMAVAATVAGRDDDGSVRLLDVSEALRSGTTLEGNGGSEDDFSSGLPAATPDFGSDGESGPGVAPSGPSSRVGGSNELFPAICEVDFRAGLILDERIVCSGIGVLVLEGWAGPWHNDIQSVILSDGATAVVVYESNGRTVELVSGVNSLDSGAAAFGVDHLRISFSAEGQHVHLVGAGGSDAPSATFTLQLGE